MGPLALLRGVYRLLTEETEPDTKIGWQPIAQIRNSLANIRQGLAILGLSIKRPGKPKGYDRYLHVHGPSVTVLVCRACNDGITRYGFIQMERAYRARLREALLPPDGRGYIRRLYEDGLWGALMEGPGTMCTELVGGMIDPEDYPSIEGMSDEAYLRAAVICAAKREVKSEMGVVIEVDEIDAFLDRTCPDPAHTLHPQSIVIGHTTQTTGEQNLDDDEAAKKVIWLTLDEITDRLRTGSIDDGRVVNALFFAGLLLPPTK